MPNRERIKQSIERCTGHARELLEIILREIDDAAEAFRTGVPPGEEKPQPHSGNCCQPPEDAQ